MILVDANILILAVIPGDRREAASGWLERQLWEASRVGMPWPSLLAFIRVVTNPRLRKVPTPVAEAWTQVEEWLACEAVWTPLPTESHARVLGGLLRKTGADGNLVQDAHLAALAIEHSLTVCSLDADFARFPGVKWFNPLAPK